MKENLITKNKKAYFDYEIMQTYEAWIKLLWHEVKSIRNWHVNLKGAYVSFIWWHNLLKWMHITPWKTLNSNNVVDWAKDREIFLHKKDIYILKDKQKESWFSIIPLDLYFKWSLIKVKIWLWKWKKDYDKKQTLKERTLDKEAKMYLKKFI